MDIDASKMTYEIPDEVKKVLNRASAVRFVSPEETTATRFPRILVVLDGKQLPVRERQRDEACEAMREVLAFHLLADKPLDVFRINTRSTAIPFDRVEGNVGKIMEMMPLPREGHQGAMSPSDYPKLAYAICIENNCDDPEEHKAFEALAESWSAYVTQNREATKNVQRIF